MKTKIVICILILMFSAFVGSVFGGTEGDTSTAYGLGTGYNAAYDWNTFIGAGAGAVTTHIANTFVGALAGSSNSMGFANTFVGIEAGYASTTGYDNTFLGGYAGMRSDGHWNTFVGMNAGYFNNGNNNTIIGRDAGYNYPTSSGSNNVFLGNEAGADSTGSYNVFLGYQAGYNETGSNKLYIANSDTALPLIWGDFSSKYVGINGYLGVGTQAPVRAVHLSGSNAVFRMDRIGDTAGSTSAFQMVRANSSGNIWKVYVVGVNATGTDTGEFVIWDNGTNLSGAYNRRMTIANNGDVTFPGNVFANSFGPSSLTLKDNVRTYENALDTVNRLRGVSFDWKDSGKPAVGLIAEEVAKVVPEVVAYNNGAAAGVNYASLVGVLVEAVKEQQAQHQAEMKEQLRINEEQQKIISAHSEKIAELEKMLMSK